MLLDCTIDVLRKLNWCHLERIDLIDRNKLRDVIEVLKVLKVTSKAFSRVDCNLLSAEKTILFVQRKLGSMRTDLAMKMKSTIERRFEESRSYLAHILMYLETRDLNVIHETDVIHYLDKLIRRLYKFDPNESDLVADANGSSTGSNASLNFETELNLFL